MCRWSHKDAAPSAELVISVPSEMRPPSLPPSLTPSLFPSLPPSLSPSHSPPLSPHRVILCSHSNPAGLEVLLCDMNELITINVEIIVFAF